MADASAGGPVPPPPWPWRAVHVFADMLGDAGWLLLVPAALLWFAADFAPAVAGVFGVPAILLFSAARLRRTLTIARALAPDGTAPRWVAALARVLRYVLAGGVAVVGVALVRPDAFGAFAPAPVWVALACALVFGTWLRAVGARRAGGLAIAAAVLLGLGQIATQWREEDEARHRVRTGLAAMLALQASIARHVEAHGRLPDAAELPAPLASAPGYTLAVEPGGRIVITFTTEAQRGELAGRTLELVPELTPDGLRWSCTGGTLAGRYRPPACR